MRQFFPGMRFQFPSNISVGGSLEDLAVNNIRNDRLVFSSEISFNSWIICSRVIFNPVMIFSLVINM